MAYEGWSILISLLDVEVVSFTLRLQHTLVVRMGEPCS